MMAGDTPMTKSKIPDKIPDKILVVDDISKNIQVLGSVLGKEGYAVSYATDGIKALEMVGSESFDLILLDIMMPGMDGFQVCRRLKAMPETREVPVLFLTAKSEQDDIVRGLELGAVDYLTKPFNAAELVARVKTHIALRNTRIELSERNLALEEKTAELQQLLDEIKILRGVLPICSRCKQIRDDQGYWNRLEAYIEAHSDALFSHGICPECADTLYGGEQWYRDMKKKPQSPDKNSPDKNSRD